MLWILIIGYVIINLSSIIASPYAVNDRISASSIDFDEINLKDGANDNRNTKDDEDDDQSDSLGIITNCTAKRLFALNFSIENPQIKNFIPECNEKQPNFYSDVQCHQSTGYCWCVEITNGHPIRGTSSYNSTPDCQQRLKKKSKNSCSLKRKLRLINYLQKKLRKEKPQGDVISWKYHQLDINGNNLLEKKEWLIFRRELTKGRKKNSAMKNCAKSFFTIDCDVDRDSKIGPTEWKMCIRGTNLRNDPTNSIRRGPNPFSTILKSESK